MSAAGPGNVLFIGGTDCEGFVISRVGGRVNARVKGVSSCKIRHKDNINDSIVKCFQGQELLIRSSISFNFAREISSNHYLISAHGKKSSTDWVGTCASAYFRTFHIDEDS